MILLVDRVVVFRDSKDFVDGVDDAVCGVLVQLLQNAIVTNTEKYNRDKY